MSSPPKTENPSRSERRASSALGKTRGSLTKHSFILTWVVRKTFIALAQILAVLTVLYFFLVVIGEHLVAGTLRLTPVPPVTYLTGWARFVASMFEGDWGTITVGTFQISTWTYASYYIPYSVELAALALAITLVAYPIGLKAGWKPNGLFDRASEGYSAITLFFPALLLSLLLIDYLWVPYNNLTGDFPVGTLPFYTWFDSNGGIPSWIGLFGNTMPTGFPLIDALWHRDWAMEFVTLLKTLIAALVIAAAYIAVFLRYTRRAAREALSAEFLRAGKAHGIPDSRLLWRHAGRRVLPLYIFAFGNTFGAFVLIQSVVEYMFQTSGALYWLLYGGGTTLIGGGSSGLEPLVIALIFLLSILIAAVSIAAEAVAMALDPAWRRSHGER